MNLTASIHKISAICDKYKALSKATGENYNIFKVINRTTQEVGVHSAFIANLLNPKEEHGNNATFLKLFIEELGIEDFDVDSANVQVERYIGGKGEETGGRIDIDIWDKNDYHIIIENKIYAGDQENQMLRYFNYGKSYKKSKLYYLTLDGSTPDEKYSCNNKLEVEKDYHLLSYAKHIKHWLERCREKAVNSPLLREGISHYINLIKYLTNQTMSESLKNEITKVLRQKENIENLMMLKQAIPLVEKSLQLDFWTKLSRKFKDENYTIKCDDFAAEVEKYYSSNNKYYGFKILIKNDEQSKLYYRIRIHDRIYAGFNKTEFANYSRIVTSIKGAYIEEQEGYWLSWKYLDPILNFKKINEETCKALANMDETVERMFKDIDSDIKEFIDKLEAKQE